MTVWVSQSFGFQNCEKGERETSNQMSFIAKTEKLKKLELSVVTEL
jgi:hypothetical protein